MDLYENLKQAGYELPPQPPLGGIYTPVRQIGDILYTAGQGYTKNGVPVISGKAGKDVSLEEAQEAARGAVLNMLSALHGYLGDLNRIGEVVKILGFVASAEDFYNQPLVMNGASQLLVDVFGDIGRHARSAIGTNVLPGNLTVEIEGIFKLKE